MPKLTSVPTEALQARGYYHDSLHLYLDVQKPGRSASWAFQYESFVAGRSRSASARRSVELVPQVSRELARRKAAELNSWLAEGKDPREQLRLKRERRRTFGDLAAEKIAQLALNWKNPVTQTREWTRSLKIHAARLWALPASTITDDDVIGVLAPLWHERGLRLTCCACDFTLCWVCDVDEGARARPQPATAGVRRRRARRAGGHRGACAFDALPGSPKFLKRVRGGEGDDMRVLELAMLVGLRSAEIDGAQWSEVDLKGRLWTIPWSRMKSTKAEAKKRGDRPHKVVLTDRMVAIFRAMEGKRVAGNPYVFPAQRQPEKGKPINRAAIEVAMRELDVDRRTASPHGWRATFMEFAKNHFHDGEAVAHWCQGHAPAHGKVGQAYSREQPVALCGELWGAWSDFSDQRQGQGG